ncbi:hypothetical protein ATK06_0541 [Corynebacterium renale]|uniref:Uncharacterized protein n=1 Tax=Corynebacterium renale TaxID=1724 RepID=A0A2A9DNI9_9CORY|nr:hypothetical protein ATK06_0541 [Corynebacterium renale]
MRSARMRGLHIYELALISQVARVPVIVRDLAS